MQTTLDAIEKVNLEKLNFTRIKTGYEVRILPLSLLGIMYATLRIAELLLLQLHKSDDSHNF